MSKLTSFVRLDFVTVKPYFTVKNLLVFAAVALFLTAMSGNIASGIGVGLMIGTNFVGYPFSLGEKSNMTQPFLKEHKIRVVQPTSAV